MPDQHEILNNKKILIVDDEPDILETLEEILDMCLIDSAPNYETAKKFLEKNHYDVAVLDIMGVRGYDLLELATSKGIPSLMLTAHALSPDNLIKSIKKGARSYIPKDKIADIATYLADILQEAEEETRESKWFQRLKPVFDKKFGADWREKDREFWDEFDKGFQVSKDELGQIM
ncbi:MAG: response regulator [Deltaproteobacteria bacterium]|nr:MAG: response regulator [Desulfobacteraceae bacterium 4484_190.3]RLB19190.1 MAG: response regulator [Deltaproteobacteria bacterium]